MDDKTLPYLSQVKSNVKHQWKCVCVKIKPELLSTNYFTSTEIILLLEGGWQSTESYTAHIYMMYII